MSHNKNGKTSHGQNVSRKVDDFSAGNNGPRKLKSYLIARPNEVHEFLRNMYLICLEDCSSSGIDEIFGENGGSGNYPIFVQPEDPVQKRGRVHNYLGMVFDFTVIGTAKVTMPLFTGDFLEGVKDIEGVSPTPATNDLFKVLPMKYPKLFGYGTS
jgi:hypothetical protein